MSEGHGSASESYHLRNITYYLANNIIVHVINPNYEAIFQYKTAAVTWLNSQWQPQIKNANRKYI